MRNKLGFKWRPPYHVQKLTADHVAQRLQFCREMLGLMEEAEAAGQEFNVVFSDDSRFCMEPDSSWVRVKAGPWNVTATIATVKYPVGVMVWGAIGVGLKPGLVRMSKHVNAAEYQQAVLSCGLADAAAEQYGSDNFFFMQDGASMHTSEATLEALQSQMQILPGWPPNSPDLNPIEMLWAIIGRRLAGKDFHSEDEIFDEVDRIWDDLAQETIDGLVRSFRRRLELCLACGGNSISQLLSSHRLSPREQDIAGATGVPEFTDEIDAWILQYVDDHGRRWKAMREELAKEVSGFTATILKNRWIQLWIHMRNAETVGLRCAELEAEDDLALGETGLDDEDEKVVDVFDAADPELDDADAEHAVDEEDPIDDEVEKEVLPPTVRYRPSPYIAFCNEQRAVVKAKEPTASYGEIGKILGRMWRGLTQAARDLYNAEAGPRPKQKVRGKGKPRDKPKGGGGTAAGPRQ